MSFPLGDSVKARPVVVVTDECSVDGTMMVATTSDLTIRSDNTTILQRGCHPFITKDCSVAYGFALVLEPSQVNAIRSLIDGGNIQFDPTQKLDPTALREVQLGFGDGNGVPLDQRDLTPKAHKFAASKGII